MSLRDDLIAVKALIDTPEKWWKGGWHNVGCECALTACQKTAGALSGPRVFAMTDALFEAAGRKEVASYNDDPATTHADVMALFDRAIAAASPTPSIDMSKQGAGDAHG